MQTRSAIAAFIVLVSTLALAGPVAAASEESLGAAISGLTKDEQARFAAGREVFVENETVADGVGPVFNDDSCGACHVSPATGGGGIRTVTRFGRRARGTFDPLAGLGGSLIQEQGIGAQGECNYVAEVVPPVANVTALRRTTPLFGLGLVDALDDRTLLELAARQRARTPATAGRARWVADAVGGGQRVGRFGWKAQVPSLLHFSGDAYLNEMGITTPFFPEENCPQGDCSLLRCDPVADPEDDGADVFLFADFMSFLAPPPRADGAGRRVVRDGQRVFERLGCADCHVATLKTGWHESPALRAREFSPYSDFLLHDMGSLGDGIAQDGAGGREMRTAPLWGLRTITSFLHDGRATTIEAAILAHDGQGAVSRDRFRALDSDDRRSLLRFLRSL
ncbi:MAG: di-heme oxidoredictase family protein [Candidatus Binatia bacterium]